jgi:hypothetical protein
MISEYQKLNSEDRTAFHRWLWTNTIVGAILLVGLIIVVFKFADDQSGWATAKNATMTTKAEPK